MAKPKGKVKIEWSPKFAYAIGLIVSNGNLSPDGRHINFTSKDAELIEHFITALDITGQHIGKKARGSEKEKKYFVVQFSDVIFYRFLKSIGLVANKSKLLEQIDVPNEHFSHFIRGLFDGDGTFYSYWDPRWKSSFMYYTAFASSSPIFLRWLKTYIFTNYGVLGQISSSTNDSAEQLRFAKNSSVLLLKIMYKDADGLYLSRKYLKSIKALSILSQPTKNARVV